MLPDLRAEARLEDGMLRLRASAPMPGLPGLGWINLDASVPPFAGGPRLAALRLGRMQMNPGFGLALGVIAANLALGGKMGDRLMASFPTMAVSGDGIVLGVALDDAERHDLTRQAFGALRGADLPDGAVIETHYLALREAMEAGLLPARGSFLPYLRLMLQTSLARATAAGDPEAAAEALPNELTAGLFALGQICGDQDFRQILDRLVGGMPPDRRVWRASCDKVTLAGRIDSRRHFIISAAIEAASTRAVSLTVGEVKELIDILQAGGYDFTDITADNAGNRFAGRFLRAAPADWPGLMARLEGEAAFLPSYDGIPAKLPRAEFEARFGAADSPAYRAVVAEIEHRIDLLPLHADAPPLAGAAP
jgi:hypothetical protein